MRERNSPSRLHIGHTFSAVVLAILVAGLAHTWFSRRAVAAASAAQLSFDPAIARHVDPGFSDASSPAIDLAQSILTDSVISRLATPAYLSSSNLPTRIGEFRSRLELSQPSANLLLVRFRDADPAKSRATANAVANALAAWSPTSAAASPTPVAPQPVRRPAPSSAANPTPAPQAARPSTTEASAPLDSLAPSLGELEEQLNDTDHQLDHLSAPAGGHASSPYDLPSYAQSRRQQLLRARVLDAEQKFAALRSQFPRDQRDQYDAIREELSAILPANRIGTSAALMREERARLVHAAGVIEQERLAMEHEEAARSLAAASAPAPAPPPTSAPASAPASGISESDIGASAPSTNPAQPSPPAPSTQNPLALVRIAGAPVPTSWWPPVALGLLCGLLFLAVVAVYHRPSAIALDEDEPVLHATRFITPDPPAVASPAPHPDAAGFDPSPAPVETSRSHRASFQWDPEPGQNPAPESHRASFALDPAPRPAPGHDNEPEEYARLIETPAPAPAPVAVEPFDFAPMAVAATNGHHSAVALEEAVFLNEHATMTAEAPREEAAVSEPPIPEVHMPEVQMSEVHMPEAPVAEAAPEKAPPRSIFFDPPYQPPAAIENAPHNGNGGPPHKEPERASASDPWADEVIRSLSQTTLGKIFENPSAHEPESAASAEDPSAQLPSHPIPSHQVPSPMEPQVEKIGANSQVEEIEEHAGRPDRLAG